MGFNNWQQALLMFLAIFLPSLIVWITSPDPLITEVSARFLVASLIGAIIAVIKEARGGVPVPATT